MLRAVAGVLRAAAGVLRAAAGVLRAAAGVLRAVEEILEGGRRLLNSLVGLGLNRKRRTQQYPEGAWKPSALLAFSQGLKL